MNNIAWSKAPKTSNYTDSESLDLTSAAAVLQFNEGIEYVKKNGEHLIYHLEKKQMNIYIEEIGKKVRKKTKNKVELN